LKEFRVPLKFGLSVPQGWIMELAHLKGPVEAYDTITQVARVADEAGFESLWFLSAGPPL
jgi:alkanesulfonate monooxygenase SsuD/methylene tetrahydromethanopterin reductase-like flavin-dependent oxidoreductase (luciferase family)